MSKTGREEESMMVSKKRLRITRDGTLFVAGLAGIAYETLSRGAERPTLLLLFAAMIGLPAFLNKDEKEQAKEDEKDG